MRSSELLADAFSRIDTIVSGVLNGLEMEKANWRPGGSGNSIAWLIWHLGRSQDEQIAQVAGVESVWRRDGYAGRFAFDLEPDSTGYGHSTQQIDAVHLDSTDLLRQYHQGVLAQSLDFVGTLADADPDRVVDKRWNPPVTLGVRLISIADDCVQHGGQAKYVLAPYADWNLLKFPDRDQALEEMLDLTMHSDVFPAGFHGSVTAGVTVGSTVYIAGAGRVGLAAATSAHMLGAAVVIVGDVNASRLAQARTFACETIDLSQGDSGSQIEQLLGVPEVDCAVDAMGLEAKGHGHGPVEAPATVLNWLMDIMDIMAAGGSLGIPGLMMAILHDKVSIAKNVNAKAISLMEAPRGYAEFDAGAATKYVLNPNGYLN